jgi:hypothetical protein
MGKPVQRAKLLLVEGRDEEEFFGALLGRLGIDDIEVRAIEGKSRLGDRMKVLVKGPSAVPIQSVGIVQDGDNDPRAAFQSIRAALATAGLPVPDTPQRPQGNNPRVTVMILPDGVRPGMLEDLCLAAVRSDPALACVDEFFVCLEERASSASQNPAKARVRSFLAGMEWQEERLFQALQERFQASPVAEPGISRLHAFLATRYKPDLRLGTAAQAGYWPLDDAVFQPLSDFLRRL